eukprot:979382-Rhodomonas_salina.1
MVLGSVVLTQSYGESRTPRLRRALSWYHAPYLLRTPRALSMLTSGVVPGGANARHATGSYAYRPMRLLPSVWY